MYVLFFMVFEKLVCVIVPLFYHGSFRGHGGISISEVGENKQLLIAIVVLSLFTFFIF